MKSRLIGVANAMLFALGVSCLILPAYMNFYAKRVGNEAVSSLHDWEFRSSFSLSDGERSDFKEKVQDIQIQVQLSTVNFALAGCAFAGFAFLFWAIRFVIWYFLRIGATPDRRTLWLGGLVFLATTATLLGLGILTFQRRFAKELPKPEQFVLSRYRRLIAAPRPDLSQFEQYLLEPAADSKTILSLTPDHNEQSRNELRTPPKGLRHAKPGLLVPRAVIQSRAGAARLVVGPDGDTLYLLDVLTGTLSTIDSKTHQVLPGAAVLSPASMGMCFSSDGAHIYVTSRTGKLSVVRTADLSVLQSLSVATEAFDVVQDTDQRLLISGTTSRGRFSSEDGVYVFDVTPQGIVRSGELMKTSLFGKSIYYAPQRDLLFLSPYHDGQCFALRVGDAITLGRATEPQDIAAVTEKNGEAVRWYHQIEKLETGGNFSISPDGRFVVVCGRTTLDYHPEEGKALDLQDLELIAVAARLPAHHAVAWDLERNVAFLAFTEGGDVRTGRQGVMGRLSVYSLPDWKELHTYQLSRPAYQLAWDPPRKQLFAALDEDSRLYPLEYKRGDALSSLCRHSYPEEAIRAFRVSNRLTGENEGPIVVYDLSADFAQ